jgi:ABC-type transporter Mla subunit MlaD
MRKILLTLVVVAAVVFSWLAVRRHLTYQLNARTYFHNAPGLQGGTQVWVDGVDLGSVTSVRVRPELGARPVEVLMAVRTPYDLRIPKGSIVSLATQGVLGPVVVEIDTREASGPPIGNDGVLESLEITDEQTAHAIEVVGNALIDASKRLQKKDLRQDVDHGH